MATPPADLPLHQLFLGPHGENTPLLTRLALDVFAGNRSWRDQGGETPAWSDATVGPDLTTATRELIERLKATYPFHAQQWVAHQQADVMLGSYLGVLAGTLSNGNIVAAESSPAGIALEFEVSRQIMEMLGYPVPPIPDPATDHASVENYQKACLKSFGWGHLLSGGSAANMEALWLARLVTYLPVRVQAAAKVLGLNPKIDGEGFGRAAIDTLETWTLLGMSPTEALDTLDAFKAAVLERLNRGRGTDEQKVARAGRIVERALASKEPSDAVREAMRNHPPTIMAPGTAHYSVVKSADVLGIDRDAVQIIHVDDQFRLDPAHLTELLDAADKNGRAVIAVVAVIGTTEEGAVDPLRDVLHLSRTRRRKFWVHADGAWGGYLTSLLRRGPFETAVVRERARLSAAGIPVDADGLLASDASDAAWVNAMCATIESSIRTLESPEQRDDRRLYDLQRRIPAAEADMLIAPDAGYPEDRRAAAVVALTDFVIAVHQVLGHADIRTVTPAPDAEAKLRDRFLGSLDIPSATAEHLHEQLGAIAEADSITIDPHKLGHTAYPAGMACFRDDRVRDVMAVKAPYIAREAGSSDISRAREPMVHAKGGVVTIGSPNRHTLEGSRPASAAASVWLTHRVLPLRADGHGRLMARHLSYARRVWEALGTIDDGDRRIVPFMPTGPDSNLVLFVGFDKNLPATIPALNEFNTTLAKVLAPEQPNGYPVVTPPQGSVFVSQTELGPDKYPFRSFGKVLADHGLHLPPEDYTADDAPELTMLRIVCADPYVGAPGSLPDPVATVVDEIREALLGVA